MAGGGTLLSSRQRRCHLVAVPGLPALNDVAHVANWRGPPVFPLKYLVETSPRPPQP